MTNDDFENKRGQLAQSILDSVKQKNWQIAVAESCTGGLLASTITSVSGSSDIFGYGVVSYANDAKIKLLGVKPETLEQFGAVSSEVAIEMAIGVQQLSNANIAISTSGIAGPTGGENKPIGLVYLGFFINGEIYSKKLLLSGERIEIQNQTVIEGLSEVIDQFKSA